MNHDPIQTIYIPFTEKLGSLTLRERIEIAQKTGISETAIRLIANRKTEFCSVGRFIALYREIFPDKELAVVKCENNAQEAA